jgi:hypothetical protein
MGILAEIRSNPGKYPGMENLEKDRLINIIIAAATGCQINITQGKTGFQISYSHILYDK